MYQENRNEVAECNEALMYVLLEPRVTDYLRQRQLIQDLLPVITALVAAGVNFEKMATVLRDKGMTLTGDMMRLWYFEKKLSIEETDAEQIAGRYKHLAEQVMNQMTAQVGKNVQAAVERAVEEAKKKMEQTVHRPSGRGEYRGKRARPKKIIAAAGSASRGGDSESGKSLDALPPVRKRRSLDDINKLLNEHIDLSTIPRRSRP